MEFAVASSGGSLPLGFGRNCSCLSKLEETDEVWGEWAEMAVGAILDLLVILLAAKWTSLRFCDKEGLARTAEKEELRLDHSFAAIFRLDIIK